MEGVNLKFFMDNIRGLVNLLVEVVVGMVSEAMVLHMAPGLEEKLVEG